MSENDVEFLITESTITMPTMALRFIHRDGKRILQQQFYELKTGGMVEWRDVPLVEET